MAEKPKRKRDGWDGIERRSKPLVLLACDDPLTAELLGRVFVARDFTAIATASFDDALVKVNDHVPRAVVIDLSAQGLGTSMRLLDLLRQHDDPAVRSSRAVVIADSNSNRRFAFESGADGFLGRPFHANDLVRIVQDAMAVPPEERALYRRTLLNQDG